MQSHMIYFDMEKEQFSKLNTFFPFKVTEILNKIYLMSET